MPKSDTWPGGTGLDIMTGMDSAGSCDSVVSANSGFSDDSLDHLSAEEKACLMFLEETIESLETEEDSGLSNDEPDQLPSSGSVADKVADLSASMSRSMINSSQKDASTKLPNTNKNTKVEHSYLVPTPFVVANSSPCSVVTARPDLRPHKNLRSKPKLTPSGTKTGSQQNQNPGVPQAPLEVDVVIPPHIKPRDQSLRPYEGLRGPLSYDALVHLRRSASTKKTPLCPTVDHTIDRHPPAIMEETQPNFGNLSRSDRLHSEAFKPKTGPPTVPPKPKRIPANISVKTQNAACIDSDSSFTVRRVTDAEVARQEALQKLGLAKEAEAEACQSPPKPHASLDPAAKKHVKAPFNVNPARSPSFCHSQVSTEPKTRPLQSSVSFHHYSRHDQKAASHPAPMNRLKTAVLERSATVDSQRNDGHCFEPPHVITAEKKAATTAQPVPPKPSNSVGYTVMVVPGMGADRKEALRKLGLLKESNK